MCNKAFEVKITCDIEFYERILPNPENVLALCRRNTAINDEIDESDADIYE